MTPSSKRLSRTRSALARRMPFLLYLALRSLGYLAATLMGLAVSAWLLRESAERPLIERGGVVFSLVLSLGFNLLFGVNDLLGQGVLFNFVAGRYRRPRVEDRVLLFIDMKSSTVIAERLGEAGFLDFLNRFVADVTESIVAQRGAIHKYVGDEIIVTWSLGPYTEWRARQEGGWPTSKGKRGLLRGIDNTSNRGQRRTCSSCGCFMGCLPPSPRIWNWRPITRSAMRSPRMTATSIHTTQKYGRRRSGSMKTASRSPTNPRKYTAIPAIGPIPGKGKCRQLSYPKVSSRRRRRHRAARSDLNRARYILARGRNRSSACSRRRAAEAAPVAPADCSHAAPGRAPLIILGLACCSPSRDSSLRGGNGG